MHTNLPSFRRRILAAMALSGVVSVSVVNASCTDVTTQGGSTSSSSSTTGDPMCPPCVDATVCLTPTALAMCMGGGTAGAGGMGTGGGAGGNVGGMGGGTAGAGGMAGAGGGAAVVCPSAEQIQVTPCVSAFVMSGPSVVDGACCYETQECFACGRPFLVDGVAQVAPIECRDDWRAQFPATLPMDSITRDALAQAWLDDARMEHASIASFARFTLQLLALGAPADLLEATQRASLDEVVHAQLCFGLAARYGGVSMGPSAWTSPGVMTSVTLREAAISAVKEGCVGETIAATIVAEQWAQTTDDIVRKALERIAVDEANHAELAWRFVAWAVRTGDADVREAIRNAFVEALQMPANCAEELAEGLKGAVFQAHGRLLPAQSARLRRLAIEEVIWPAANTLLQSANDVVRMGATSSLESQALSNPDA